jgi:hypothetical protein
MTSRGAITKRDTRPATAPARATWVCDPYRVVSQLCLWGRGIDRGAGKLPHPSAVRLLPTCAQALQQTEESTHDDQASAETDVWLQV